MVGERGEEQGLETFSPSVSHIEKAKRLANVVLTETQECFVDVARLPRPFPGRQFVLLADLELKARVELPEIVQEGDDGEAGLDDGADADLSRRPLEAIAKDGIAEKGLETGRNVGRVVLETMEAVGGFVLSPGIQGHNRLLVRARTPAARPPSAASAPTSRTACRDPPAGRPRSDCNGHE